MKILHLNLYRKYFDAIANGTKTIEYRKKTDYWKRRIEDREYDYIQFRNGYAKVAPTMLVEHKGYKEVIRTGYGNGVEYEIKLGKIIEVSNA
jgi:ASC-1-like (ASCH) protein|tara:strand:+ start:258 stop:533 length:276 start_codon:yes stop_codon:yes gene_type:complete